MQFTRSMKASPEESENVLRISVIRSSRILTEITDTEGNRLRPTERAVKSGLIVFE